jgi:hypothetical protein
MGKQWPNDHQGTKGDTNNKDTPQAKTPDNVREDSELEEYVDAPVHDAGLKPIPPNSTDVDQTSGIRRGHIKEWNHGIIRNREEDGSCEQ